jgi:hypothetical protein
MRHSLNKMVRGHGRSLDRIFSINVKPFPFHFRLYKTERNAWQMAEKGGTDSEESENKVEIE